MGTVNDILVAISKLPLSEKLALKAQVDRQVQRAKTDAAIQELRDGGGRSFDSVDALMADLRA